MSTAWWITVLVLACSACLLIGYVLRAELDRYQRHVYDLDFTRRRVGA